MSNSQGNTEVSRVPPELTRSIVECVTDGPTLASLSRVSRTVNQEAERVLYRAPFPCNREQSVALLDVMAATPRVAAHVQSLVVDMTDDHDVNLYQSGLEVDAETHDALLEDNEAYLQRCLRLLSRALKNMPKLRALKIFPDVEYNVSIPAWPLRYCTSHLRELRCGFSWDEELITFLSTQPDITDLCLEHNLNRPSQTVPEVMVPQLSTFEGMPSTAAKICPKRPVTHLSIWLDHDSDLTSLIPQLALSTQPILSLDLADYNVVSLSEIVMAGGHIHFPQLRFLGPFIITPWDEKTCFSDIALFKYLDTIVLLDFERRPRSPGVLGVPAQRTFVNSLHAACPSLRRVAFSYSVGEPWNCLWSLELDGWVYNENMPVKTLWRDV